MSGSGFFSRRDLVRDVRTFVVAAVACSVVMATPTVAAELVNADTVDGKHAVGAGATPAQRAGKLVATNANGHLPNNIVVKAQDADRLDGKDQNDFTPRNAVAGSVQIGVYNAWGGDGNYIGDGDTFRSRLPVQVPGDRVQFIASDAGPTAECPGVGQVVPLRWMCVYEQEDDNRTFTGVYAPDTGQAGASSRGFGIAFSCGAAASCWSYGTWAVKAGA